MKFETYPRIKNGSTAKDNYLVSLFPVALYSF